MKRKRLLLLTALTAAAVFAGTLTGYAGEWKKETSKWYYYGDDGAKAVSTVTPDGYTVDENGVWDPAIPQKTAEELAAEAARAAEEAAVEAEKAAEEAARAANGGQNRLFPDATSNNYNGSKAEPIFRVITDKPLIALTFDAGSERGNALEIMDILDKYQIKATFFVTGDWVRQNADLVPLIVSRGHELGNHSTSHPSFPKLSTAQMIAQVTETHALVKELTGIDMCVFRFPYGDYNNASMDVLKSLGYYSIQWSADSLDWKNLGRQPLLDRVLNSKNVGNGSIILMHMAAMYTPSALDEMILTLKARGYEFAPVSQIIHENNYHMDYAGNQIPN